MPPGFSSDGASGRSPSDECYGHRDDGPRRGRESILLCKSHENDESHNNCNLLARNEPQRTSVNPKGLQTGT
jgi:hypothetical protein